MSLENSPDGSHGWHSSQTVAKSKRFRQSQGEKSEGRESCCRFEIFSTHELTVSAPPTTNIAETRAFVARPKHYRSKKKRIQGNGKKESCQSPSFSRLRLPFMTIFDTHEKDDVSQITPSSLDDLKISSCKRSVDLGLTSDHREDDDLNRSSRSVPKRSLIWKRKRAFRGEKDRN